MRRTQWTLAAWALLALHPMPGHAQRAADLRVGMRSAPAVDDAGSTWTHDLRVDSRSYWKPGFVVGTVVAAGGFLFVAAAHGEDDSSFSLREIRLITGVGTLLGGVPGAIIGSLFPKAP
ncbi:MAG TPA: hypothetical protein VFN22_05510 [Gemmatimonadales bacterium]|nr:hypothetical protein [Gemmatimonadales bacterium]